MRKSRTYGSVRGALSNGRPYRDQATSGSLSFSLDPAYRYAHAGYSPAWCDLSS